MFVVNPSQFPPPRGYSNGIVAEGRTLAIAGQIGWNARGELTSDDFTEQFAQALDNVCAVVRAAGGVPENLTQMTVYVTDMHAYRNAAPQLSAVWRPRMGRHYPTMALVGVASLLEPRAVVEISAFAVLEDLPPDTTRHG